MHLRDRLRNVPIREHRRSVVPAYKTFGASPIAGTHRRRGVRECGTLCRRRDGNEPMKRPLNYFDAMDYPGMLRDHGRPEDFVARFQTVSRDELRRLQDARFRSVVAFGWKTPFYQRLWRSAGLEPGDILSLDDVVNLPVYSKSDLMEAVEAHPPLGDFHGLDSYADADRPPLILHTTSGTTGKPQPLLFGPKSREVQNLLLARLYFLQGMNRNDVVHSVYGHGLVNGGHYIRETILHWVGAQLLTAGTGLETRSSTQVRLMRDFGATVLVGFADYLRKLSEVAIESGILPGTDIHLRMVSGHMGTDGRDALSRAWGGAEVFDWYGVGDTGAIAGEGPDHDGLYVLDDGQYLEILDIDTGQPVAEGTEGNMVCTCLFKEDVFPIIRFNTHDVSRFISGSSSLGLRLQRIAGFLGRSDNMVKLRGINVFPTAIGAILADARPNVGHEYLCEVERIDGRDEMTILVEASAELDRPTEPYETLLRNRLGVQVSVRLVPPGSLASATGTETRQKPIRLSDKRKAS